MTSLCSRSPTGLLPLKANKPPGSGSSAKRHRSVSSNRQGKQKPERNQASLSNAQQLEQDELLAELETLREAQVEIEHSQQLYAELFDLAPVGYLNLTPDGRIENANLAACALLQRSRDQIVHRSFYMFVGAADQEPFAEHLRQGQQSKSGDIATDLPLYIKRGGPPRFFELLSRRSTLFGSTEIVYRTVLRDITDRRKVEKDLRESEERTRALSANLPGGAAFIVDHRLRYLLAGVEALETLGMKPESFPGKTVRDVVGPELAGFYEPFYREALMGRSLSREHTIKGRTFLSRAVPLRDASATIYAALTVSYDITERKA